MTAGGRTGVDGDYANGNGASRRVLISGVGAIDRSTVRARESAGAPDTTAAPTPFPARERAALGRPASGPCGHRAPTSGGGHGAPVPDSGSRTSAPSDGRRAPFGAVGAGGGPDISVSGAVLCGKHGSGCSFKYGGAGACIAIIVVAGIAVDADGSMLGRRERTPHCHRKCFRYVNSAPSCREIRSSFADVSNRAPRSPHDRLYQQDRILGTRQRRHPL